jgi:ankyrin repeat protein
MGGRLCFERRNLPVVIEMVRACLIIHPLNEINCEPGHDVLKIYESGSDYQSFINIMNRRPENVAKSGLSGLTLTISAAEDMTKQLSSVSAKVELPQIQTQLPLEKEESPAQKVQSPNEQLIEVAPLGDVQKIMAALRRGADVNARGQYGNTALNIAAGNGHVEAVGLLLSAGANLENIGGADMTPLMNAAFAGHARVAEILLAHGAKINRDLINTLQLKVNIFEENAESGMVLPGAAAAWRLFLQYMIAKWEEQNTQVTS